MGNPGLLTVSICSFSELVRQTREREKGQKSRLEPELVMSKEFCCV